MRCSVYFVTRYYGQARGGLGRYEESLLPWLQRKIAIQPISIQPLPVPRWVARLFRLVGADLAAVVQNYPCYLPLLPQDAIVHLSNQNLALALLVNRVPTSVITVHDIIPYVNLVRRPLWAAKAGRLEHLLVSLNAMAIKKADQIIAISQHTKRELLQYLGIAPEKISVIYRSVDQHCFRPLGIPSDFYHRYNWEMDARYILYVGSKEPRKNLRNLCAAMGRVVATIPQAKLLIIGRQGTPEQESALTSWIEEAGLSHHVRYIPFVPLSDLPLLYNASALLAFPSWYEGFGLPPLEAMACGCPVVASNASSLPEVVGNAGILVDPADVDALAAAIVQILTDDERRQELRARGFERAKLFTPERQAEETIRVYEKLMARERFRKDV